MIASTVVQQIRHLLEEGDLSQRKIARRLGVSRGTVNAIAQGRRPDYAAADGGRSEDVFSPTVPPRRCPGCGGMVYMPCLLCHIRAVKRLTEAGESSINSPPWPAGR
jgi:hypothetical protein